MSWASSGAELAQILGKIYLILGDFENWLLCTKHQSLIELFNGRFSEVFKIEKNRIQESEMNGYVVEAKAAKTSNFLFDVSGYDGTYLTRRFSRCPGRI
jgi:hypothetical protein